MPELTGIKPRVVNAVLANNPEYVKIVDWEGKSLTFILADEIRPEEEPSYPVSGDGKKPPVV